MAGLQILRHNELDPDTTQLSGEPTSRYKLTELLQRAHCRW